MTDVAKIDLMHVQSFKDRHGRMRHYYRKPGFARATLPGKPGSPEFMVAYQAALAGGKPVEGAGAERTAPKTINALIVAYYTSAEFRALKPSTVRGYRNMLERFRAAYGDKSATTIQSHHLEAIFHQMAETPAAAISLRKRLKRVFRLAVRLGWRGDNPVSETEPPKHRVAGFAPWSEDDIAAYEAKWPSGSRERLALYLLLYTGQRRSDVVTMGRQHIARGRISVQQVKTDERLKVPIHPRLKVEIDKAPFGMTFLLTHAGRPFGAAGFTNWFVESAKAAGLSKRTPHGLRKAAARRLAEAGCSSKEISAITGHRTLREVERYTRDADQSRMADSAMDRLQEAEARTSAVNPV